MINKFAVALAFGLSCVGAASAQDNKPEETPCDQLSVKISAPSPKCYVLGGPAYTGGNTYRAGAGLRFAVGSNWFSVGGIIPSSQVHIKSSKADEFLSRAQRTSQIAREGTEWSPVRTEGNAWVATFVARKMRCFAFDNFGPPKDEGYAWNMAGTYCDSATANADKPFTSDELKQIIGWVVPK